MKVSLNWLNDYVNVQDVDPKDLAERLTYAGLEVDGIESIGARFRGVIVAKIVQVDKHPNADRLNLVTVDTGREKNQVVCGAPNVRPDSIIAYATLGATVLNRKDGSEFILGPATIRGVESCGMICSLDELGLSESYTFDEDGIWILNDTLPSPSLGQPLEEALGLEADVILDTAPTANRGDWMSMLGVARDVAALLDKPLHVPQGYQGDYLSGDAPTEVSLSDSVSEDAVCQFYAGAVLEGAQNQSAPDWMVKRLEAAGVRSIDVLVDITNYVMLEMGQPLHAFDLDYLLGDADSATVGVRRAEPSEALTTLDEEVYELTEQAVVITRNNDAVALAGVMGGASTRILENTSRIFLEAAVFPSATTRKSAKSVGIRTESSARFERGVERMNCEKAFRRAIGLYQELAGARLIDVKTAQTVEPPQPQVITLRPERVEAVLAQPVSVDESQSILEKLGFSVEVSGDALCVTVPSFRAMDVTREIDLIEEVARIKGYEATVPVLPTHTQTVMRSPRRQFVARLHQVMRGAGLNEAMTNSLIGPQLLAKTGFAHDEALEVAVTNSHSPEHTLMRQSLLPNLLEMVQLNMAQGNERVALYELGRTYFKRGKTTDKNTGVVEKLTLSGVISGDWLASEWTPRAGVMTDFYDVKGVIETLVNHFGFSDSVKYEATDAFPHLHLGKTAALITQKKSWGVVGQLNPLYQEKLKLKLPVFLFELDVDQWFKWLKQTNVLANASVEQVISPYQSVTRDMAFVANKNVSHAELVATVNALNETDIVGFDVFDEYQGKGIPEDSRSLAYRLTLQSKEKTLTDLQIEDLVAKVKHALSHQFSVQYR